MRAAWPWPWTGRSCRAPCGSLSRSVRARAWRCSPRCREDDPGMADSVSAQLDAAGDRTVAGGEVLSIAGRTMQSRLLLGTGGLPPLEGLADPVGASGGQPG